MLVLFAHCSLLRARLFFQGARGDGATSVREQAGYATGP
jgi:hypothetical protein